MIPSLRHVLSSRRTLAGLAYRDIERHGDLDRSSFQRFEKGGGTTDLDALVSTYAKALDTTPVQLWTEALELYASDPEGVRADATLKGAGATRRSKPRRASR